MKVALFYDYGNNVGLGHYMRIEAISQVIRNDWSKNITYLFWACDQTESPNQFQWEKFKYAVVDSYVLKPKFYQAIEESPAELIIIDDSNINHKNEYESTNIYPHIWGDREYIPLRKSFWSIDKPKVKNTIRNVLVMFGGTERARDYSQFLHPLLDNYNVRCLTPTDRNVFTERRREVHP